ncbi:MAG: hypothetical protein JRN01_00465 [Nitrososphaerota archaeon]|nr:hypothetical protein [Nitrososphaerota archaeon]
MDANELLALIKELNDELDNEWKKVLQMQDQIGEFSKKNAHDAHERYIQRVKAEIKNDEESAVPEFKKEVQAIKASYERQEASMQAAYKQKWDEIKAHLKSMMVDYFEEK